jgi:hypothetical protein
LHDLARKHTCQIKVGVYSLSLLTTEIAKEMRDNSPPEATFFKALNKYCTKK